MRKQVLLTHTAVESVREDAGSMAGTVTRYVKLYGVDHKFFVTPGTHKGWEE